MDGSGKGREAFASAPALDPALTEAHLSNRMIWPLVAYFAGRFGEAFADRVMAAAGVPRAYLDDREGWVSAAFVARFSRAVARELAGRDDPPPYDDPLWQHWRAAGWHTMDPDRIGRIWWALRALGSPGMLYGRMPAIIRQGNRLTLAEVLHQGRGHAVLRFRPARPDLPDRPEFCWSRRGFLEGFTTVWGLPRARVDHRRCMHSPGDPAGACEYDVWYRERPLTDRAVLALPSALGAAGGAAAAVAAGGPVAGAAAAGALGGLALGALLRARGERGLREEEARRLQDVIDTADARYEQLWEQQRALARALMAARKLSGYLAADLVDRIARNPEVDLALGGVRTDAAVLFADIVGFTPRCETAPPERVVAELNAFFARVDPVIARHGGIIDKRTGDGVMVVFAAAGEAEAPQALRRRAAACALDMLRALPDVAADLRALGAEPLDLRVGLAAGQLVQGNMGSEVKMEYTVIGDVVNLAARLEGLAAPGHALVEESVLEAARDLARVVEEREVRVKGRDRPVRVALLRP